jgi:hypothetical protein
MNPVATLMTSHSTEGVVKLAGLIERRNHELCRHTDDGTQQSVANDAKREEEDEEAKRAAPNSATTNYVTTLMASHNTEEDAKRAVLNS